MNNEIDATEAPSTLVADPAVEASPAAGAGVTSKPAALDDNAMVAEGNAMVAEGNEVIA